MRVAIGSDHAGFELKQHLIPLVKAGGHEVIDVGTNSTEPVDYPDFAEKVGLAVIGGRAERGIMVCGSGIGACVAANKLPGVRAGNSADHYSAHQGVEHDDMNLLVLGGRVVGTAVAEELVVAFLTASFSGEERHARRLAKVEAIEAKAAELLARR